MRARARPQAKTRAQSQANVYCGSTEELRNRIMTSMSDSLFLGGLVSSTQAHESMTFTLGWSNYRISSTRKALSGKRASSRREQNVESFLQKTRKESKYEDSTSCSNEFFKGTVLVLALQVASWSSRPKSRKKNSVQSTCTSKTQYIPLL